MSGWAGRGGRLAAGRGTSLNDGLIKSPGGRRALRGAATVAAIALVLLGSAVPSTAGATTAKRAAADCATQVKSAEAGMTAANEAVASAQESLTTAKAKVKKAKKSKKPAKAKKAAVKKAKKKVKTAAASVTDANAQFATAQQALLNARACVTPTPTPTPEQDCAAQTDIPAAECLALYALASRAGRLASEDAWRATTPCLGGAGFGTKCAGGHVTEVSIGGDGIMSMPSIPSEIGALTSLKKLSISGSNGSGPGFTTLPAEMWTLVNLETLGLSFGDLTAVPAEIENLENLSSLSLMSQKLTSLPSALANIPALTSLTIAYNSFVGDISSWAKPLSLAHPDLSLALYSNNGCMNTGGDAALETWMASHGVGANWNTGCTN